MSKTTLVMLALAVFAAGRLSYLSHRDAHPPPPPATTHDTRTAISQNDSNYLCGVFGEWIYKFPKSIFGSWAQYVGDDPWSGKLSNPHRGCNDRLRDVLVRLCVPGLSLTAFERADAKHCFVSLLVSATTNDKYLQNILNGYRGQRREGTRDDRDESLGLDYFDIQSMGKERVFWKREEAGPVMVLGNCSIDTPVPWCRFYQHSYSVGALIKVSFAMEHIKDWQVFLSAAERNLTEYKYKMVKGVER